ncbi:MAG: LysR family transcriptional regulator [Steroidobacteraceae bacterium]
MAITLRNVRYFVAVCQAQSVAGASQLVSISQSAVTEAIKELEQDLGVVLFERHARGMEMTHAGQQFLEHAYRILTSVREAQESISTRPDRLSGTLDIGVTPLLTGCLLPQLLDRFRRAFPMISVQIIEEQRPSLERLLINSELDVALLTVSQIENRQALDSDVIIHSAWCVWLPINHPLCRMNVVRLADLGDQPYISTKLDELEGVARAYRAHVEPANTIETSSIEAVRSLVARGLGFAILPEIFYSPWSFEGERLERRLLKENTSSLEIGLAWRGGSKLSVPAQNFLAIAQEQCTPADQSGHNGRRRYSGTQ